MAERPAIFEMKLQIRWGDMDAAGHVNNTVYFQYMEQLRISWFEAQGYAGGIGTGEGPVIVNAAMTFLRQLRYPGDLTGRLTTGAPGRSSFDTHVELVRSDDPSRICARGSARCVWIDYAGGQSVPMPAALREAVIRSQSSHDAVPAG